MHKHPIFISGHCAGTVAGTVRALCGHCAGTVECARRPIICYICSTCLLGGRSYEQQIFAAVSTDSAAFVRSRAKDFSFASRVHDGLAVCVAKLSCHFRDCWETYHTLRTQACKCRCVNSVSKDTKSEVFTIVLDKRCCVKYGVARARARPGWQHLVKSVRHDSPNSAQQGFNKDKKATPRNVNGRTKVENKGVAKKRTSCSHRAGAANVFFNSVVHTSDK